MSGRSRAISRSIVRAPTAIASQPPIQRVGGKRAISQYCRSYSQGS